MLQVDWNNAYHQSIDASDASEVSLDSDALRVGAEDAALSFYETQSASEAFARTPRGGDVSAPHLHAAGLHAAATPSGDAAEAAAREAMATLDHPALVDEASGLVATNVRLERERRALVGRRVRVARDRHALRRRSGRQRRRVG